MTDKKEFSEEVINSFLDFARFRRKQYTKDRELVTLSFSIDKKEGDNTENIALIVEGTTTQNARLLAMAMDTRKEIESVVNLAIKLRKLKAEEIG
jgi:hypothetical protein